MNKNQKILSGIILTAIVVVVLLISSNLWLTPQSNDTSEFPDFYTKNEDYFVTRIRDIPSINRDTYQLQIKGLIENPTSYSLDELQTLDLVEIPLTTECIGNAINGDLVATAVWKGFILFDLLETLGVAENATGVRYLAADGYYASHTLDQLLNNGVLGALYMNGVEIPPVQGFPLRIVIPGGYGAKQPAWVTEIEVIDRPLEDYWDDRGWDTAPPMEIDSKIFFPDSSTTISVNQVFEVGGCAYGGTRVAKVEYTTDDGSTWSNATIVQQIDADNVWVFWAFNISFSDSGQYSIQIRATDIYGNQQKETEDAYFDGINSWPLLAINVI